MGFDNISTGENPKLTRGEIGHIIGYRLMGLVRAGGVSYCTTLAYLDCT